MKNIPVHVTLRHKPCCNGMNAEGCIGCPASLFKKPWESPHIYYSEQPFWWWQCPQNKQTCRHKALFWIVITALARQPCSGESEARGRVTGADHLEYLAPHFSPRPPFRMDTSTQKPFDDRTECRGPRDGPFLREVLITAKLLKRQHPRDRFESEGR